jgi:hypothetical protein
MAAPKGNNFNPRGRPPKPIDWEEFEKLCGLQCTQSEMASWFHIDAETLSNRVKGEYKEDYSVVYKRFSEHGKCSLRRTQLKLAQKNTSMAIFLGKQQHWLGQTDTPIEQIVTEVLVQKFDDVMAQVKAAQSARKIEANSINSEFRSA